MTSAESFRPAQVFAGADATRAEPSLALLDCDRSTAPRRRPVDTVAMMNLRVGRRTKRREKLLGLAATILMVCGMALADWPRPRPPTGTNARRPAWTARTSCRRI